MCRHCSIERRIRSPSVLHDAGQGERKITPTTYRPRYRRTAAVRRQPALYRETEGISCRWPFAASKLTGSVLSG